MSHSILGHHPRPRPPCPQHLTHCAPRKVGRLAWDEVARGTCQMLWLVVMKGLAREGEGGEGRKLSCHYSTTAITNCQGTNKMCSYNGPWFVISGVRYSGGTLYRGIVIVGVRYIGGSL